MVGVGISSHGERHAVLGRLAERDSLRLDARSDFTPTVRKDSPAVAYEHVAVEAVEGSITLDEEGLRENTSFVVLLEQPGRRTLTVASLAPTGPVDVSDGREVATTTLTGWFNADFAMVVGLVLVLSLAPAFVIHRELMTGSREQKAPMGDQEE